jgi:putative ABC transport system permease protein
MLYGEVLRVALGALRANKLRSLLTMLGIVIGVAAVIAMVAMGTGARTAVQDRITALGTTLLTISPGQVRGSGGIVAVDERARLTMRDADALAERGRLIVAVQPEIARNFQVQYLNRNTSTSVIGTSANYPEVRKFELAAGRMFTDGENHAQKRFAVLGWQVLESLGLEHPNAIIGENIRIRSIQFEVIGVLASKGQQGGWSNPDDQILIPINTARFRVHGTDRLRSISILARSEAEVDQAMAEAQSILRREHKLLPGTPDDFNIRNQADLLTQFAETTQVFGMLLAGIAAVSLLVGGIGIMNIMLVSVTERTREIGIRKALGATRRNVLLQFLIEAVVLCMMGGVVGVLMGAGSAIILSTFFGWNTQVAPASIVMAFVFSALVGIVFGVWPAKRAAALDPIVALRYE